MDVYRTEEEQIEALKRWWQENGKSLLIGIVLALMAVYGYKGWENHKQSEGEAASNIYFDLMDAVSIAEQNPNDENSATINHLVAQLKTDYTNSTYAIYAALIAAKQAVVKDELTTAEQELQWALTKTEKGTSIYLITQLRLARVIFAQGGEDNAKRALAVLEGPVAASHSASYEEAKGDIYVSLGRLDEARSAYLKAIADAESSGVQRPLLQIKLNDLAQGDS